MTIEKGNSTAINKGRPPSSSLCEVYMIVRKILFVFWEVVLRHCELISCEHLLL